MARSLWSIPMALASGFAASAFSRRYLQEAHGSRTRGLVRRTVAVGLLAGVALPLYRDLKRGSGGAAAAAPIVAAGGTSAGTPVTAHDASGTAAAPLAPVAHAHGWRRIWDIAKAAVTGWISDGCARLGASIAFYAMFAIAPLLVIVLAIAGAVFGEEAAQGQIFAQLAGIVGAGAAKSLQHMLVVSSRHAGHGLISAIISGVTVLIGASAVFVEMKNAFDTIWKPASTKGSTITLLVRARLTAVALVLGLGFLVVASLLLSAALAGLGKWLGGQFEFLAPVMAALDLVISTAVLTVAFWALIRYLPQRRPPNRPAWIGAFSSALLFALGKHLIGLYLARESVTSPYGAAGSFVVVVLWVYYSAQILLFGAEVTRALERSHRSSAHPA